MARRLDQSMLIRNQTRVSTALATHLLSNKPDSNVVFSPLSIQVVLSVLAAGCKGETLDQFLAFLKADSTDALNSLYSELVSSILADGSPSGGPILSSANRIWVTEIFSLKPSFEKVLDTVFQAACKQTDFHKAVEVANEVNSWAERQTNGLINNVITAEEITDDTMLILANAIYFKGTWTRKFNGSETEEDDFHLLNGNRVKVPFMTSSKDQYVRKFNDFKVLGLPYSRGQDNRRFTMYLYLSDAKDGLPSLIKKIDSTPDFFERHIPQTKKKVGEFLIPKFKIEFEFEAKAMLKELGLVLPFNFGHRLTEMIESPIGRGLYVSKIKQKCLVEVNEKGTKAAAVTTCCTRRDTCGNQRSIYINFVADHPFLFVIREDVTGIVLFMGQVSDPR